MRLVLTNYQAPWSHLLQESGTRPVAISHALDSIRLYRQGEPLPKRSADYREILGYVHDDIYIPEPPLQP